MPADDKKNEKVAVEGIQDRGASVSEVLKKMLDHRLVFVVGKGGVGKSTVSIALGLAARQMGKKALLVEVGNVDTIGHMFEMDSLPKKPGMIKPDLWGVRIHPRSVIEDYMHVEIGFTFLVNRITRSKVFNNLAEATPGLKEVMTLGQIWRWEQEQTEQNKPRFDIIIVDAPATGHGLSLLRVPQTLIDMLGVGPITEQTRVVLDLLRDQEKTCLTVVTLPEELPVNEAIEFEKTARTELKMPIRATFVNGVYPEIFTREDHDEIEALLKNVNHASDGELTRPLLDTAKREIVRKELQQTYIDFLKENSSGVLVEIPFYFTNQMKVGELSIISSLLLNHLNPKEPG